MADRHDCHVVDVSDVEVHYGTGHPVIGKEVTVMCAVSGHVGKGHDVPGFRRPRDPVPEALRIAVLRLNRTCEGSHVHG